MASLANLTTTTGRTTGDVPPPLVGATLTAHGDTLYLFGGRLVPTRTMVNTLYALDIPTHCWTQLVLPNPPVARYFHSATMWEHHLVLWGGEGYDLASSGTAPLRTLDDLVLFDTRKGEWSYPVTTCAEGVERPAPRYAHLAVICTSLERLPLLPPTSKSSLIILGGQSLSNSYLHTLNVLDLNRMQWVKTGTWEKNLGTYRAIATSAQWTIDRDGLGGSNGVSGGGGGGGGGAPMVPAKSSKRLSVGMESRPTTPSPLINSFANTNQIPSTLLEASLGLVNSEGLNFLPSSMPTRIEGQNSILTYSNYNFTSVQRDFHRLSSPLAPLYNLEIENLTTLLQGNPLPPGLRFPTGEIVGRHLILFGTFLGGQGISEFSIWALDLGEIDSPPPSPHGGGGGWKKIEGGKNLNCGSWNRAVVHRDTILVMGDRERDLLMDYDHRQTNFKHFVKLSLKAHNIFQPSRKIFSLEAQKLGLALLSLGGTTDFELVSEIDGGRVGCSRGILKGRWSWFRDRMEEQGKKVEGIILARNNGLTDSNGRGKIPADSTRAPVTCRSLQLPFSLSVIQALLQYLYTLTLLTPLQHSLPVLLSLLPLSLTYALPDLRTLVVEALALKLEKGEGVGSIYEMLSLTGEWELQLVALKGLLAVVPS